MSDVYAGGLPDGTKLHPKFVSEGEETQAYGGEEGIKTSRGGPAVNGGYKTKDFLNDGGYAAGDLEVGRPGAMKVIENQKPSS